MARKRRTCTPEFQQEAVRLVREEGMTFTQVGADLGICKSVVRSWCRKPRRTFRGSTTDSAYSEPVAPNLLERNFVVEAPNRVVVGDITYLPTRAGWVYLAVLMDLFSRKFVGWAMAEPMRPCV